MTLQRIDPTKYSKQIERGLQWLQQTQEDDGSWPSLRQYKIYFTSYAILALSDSPYTKEVKCAEDFLKGKIDDHGKCSDLGGTLMCALAFWELTKEQLQHSISFMDYVLSTNNSSITNSLEGQIRELTSQVSAKDEIIRDYKERYKDADFVVSKRQLLVVALASLFITTLSLVLGIYGIKLAVGTSSDTRPAPDSHQRVPESMASPSIRPSVVAQPTGTPTK